MYKYIYIYQVHIYHLSSHKMTTTRFQWKCEKYFHAWMISDTRNKCLALVGGNIACCAYWLMSLCETLFNWMVEWASIVARISRVIIRNLCVYACARCYVILSNCTTSSECCCCCCCCCPYIYNDVNTLINNEGIERDDVTSVWQLQQQLLMTSSPEKNNKTTVSLTSSPWEK